MSPSGRFRFQPVTQATLDDLETFSQANGKFRYCSCMRWRLTSSDYKRSTKDERIAELQRRVRAAEPVGVLAYAGGRPVGWCSVAPRETYAALERNRALARIDDTPVWSVVCFFVARDARRAGLTSRMLRAATEYAKSMGAHAVEGYPVEPGPRLYTYMGSPDAFTRNGYRDVTPAGRDRLVVRRGFRR